MAALEVQLVETVSRNVVSAYEPAGKGPLRGGVAEEEAVGGGDEFLRSRRSV